MFWHLMQVQLLLGGAINQTFGKTNTTEIEQ